MGLSRTVSEINGDLSQKSQNFPNPRCSPLTGFPLELGQKTRMTGYTFLHHHQTTEIVHISSVPSTIYANTTLQLGSLVSGTASQHNVM